MRVSPPARRGVDLADQRGATVVIVVLSLVAMFAMMVLNVNLLMS